MTNRVGGFINQDGLNAPDEPTNVAGTAGDQQVEVSFTAPSDVGGSAITGYRAQSNDGIGASGSASPITITGLTNDTAYTFRVWAINAFGWSSPSGVSGSVTPVAPRAIVWGGDTGSTTNTIEYFSLSTTGNATDFGDLLTATTFAGSCSSSTRGIYAGGGGVNIIQYISIFSTGDALDFGDLTSGGNEFGGSSNETRGVFGGGNRSGDTFTNVIDYITIASTGDAVDFGDLTQERALVTGCASPTRSLFGGGTIPGSPFNVMVNTIDYVTIATTGNATDFGDLTSARDPEACSSSTRGLFGGAANDVSVNTIDYVTIASAGNATDFGDLTAATGYGSSTSSQTTGVWAGGEVSGSRTNVIQYVTIASAGNATDFGDLTVATRYLSACSSAHGGL